VTRNLAILVLLFSATGCQSEPVGPSRGGNPAPARTELPAGNPAAGAAAPSDASELVARVNGIGIRRDRLTDLLIQAHGLPLLLNLVQLEMARQELAKTGQALSAADIQAEHDRTLKKMFSEQKAEAADYPALLEQFLQRRNMSRAEWDLLMEINATFRLIASRKARGAINDEQLNEAFRQLYGEKVQVRHIQCSNLQEIAEARRRLNENEPFEEVARALSRNARTAPLGGELPPFTRQSQFPQAFKDTAFALQLGAVSDPVFADNAYHLIKLEKRIEPTVMKFEDVKDSIREDLEEGLIQQLIQEYRKNLSDTAAQSLQILDPSLKAQYAQEQQRREKQIRDREEIRREWERDRERAATQQSLPDLPPPPDAAAPTTQP